MKTRWVRVATVYHRGYFLVGGRLDCRICPYGLAWQGLADWCQPWQFADEHQLQRAVERRLALAGLRLVALASRRPGWGLRPPLPPDYTVLLAEVGRLYRPHQRAVQVNRMWQEWATESRESEGGAAAAGSDF